MVRNPLTIPGALLAAAFIMVASLGMKLAVGADFVDDEVSKRVMGVVLGAFLVAIGNFIPKTGNKEPHMSCESTELRRFAGWTFVLAGLVYSIAWLVAPVELATVLATAIAGAAVAIVVVSAAWGWRTCVTGRRATRIGHD